MGVTQVKNSPDEPITQLPTKVKSKVEMRSTANNVGEGWCVFLVVHMVWGWYLHSEVCDHRELAVTNLTTIDPYP